MGRTCKQKEILKLKVACISGLNYPNSGHRVGLWHLLPEICASEEVDSIYLIGGLVCGMTIKEEMKNLTSNHEPHKEEDEDDSKDKKRKQSKKEQIDEQNALKTQYLQDLVAYLANNLPVMKHHKTGDDLKIHIIISPAYDGKYGQWIATELCEVRKDIVVYRKGGDRLVTHDGIVIGCYPPKKASWRGEYYDTPVARVLSDQRKGSTRGIGDIGIVGCFGSSLLHPGDSSRIQKPYLSLPLLAKIDEMRTAENQIGVRIVSFYGTPAGKKLVIRAQEAEVTTYSFKDMLANEWEIASRSSSPETIKNSLQRDVIRCIGTQGPSTLRQLAEYAHVERHIVEQGMAGLLGKRISKYWPGIIYDDASRQYKFPEKFFQERVRYTLETPTTDERFLGFACLHAGCRHTDMGFIIDTMPQIALAHGSHYLIGAGDFVEGFAHTLKTNGENYGSQHLVATTYNYQENLAAYLVSRVICSIFDERWKTRRKKRVSTATLKGLISDALITFLYIPGNHCEWVEHKEFSAHSVFAPALSRFVERHLKTVLCKSYGARVCDIITELLPQKLVRLEEGQVYTLPSGLKMALLHPKMGRTLTASIRSQSALLLTKECQIVVLANFHDSLAMEEWEPRLGQRFAQKLATLKVASSFERGKMKTLDFGPAAFSVMSKDTRIIKTATRFHATKKTTDQIQERNVEILNGFEAYLKKHELHLIQHWWKGENR